MKKFLLISFGLSMAFVLLVSLWWMNFISHRPYWVLTIANKSEGMLVRVSTTKGSKRVYEQLFEGRTADAEVDDVVLDHNTSLPAGINLEFVDVTLPPGRCVLSTGGMRFDIMGTVKVVDLASVDE